MVRFYMGSLWVHCHARTKQHSRHVHIFLLFAWCNIYVLWCLTSCAAPWGDAALCHGHGCCSRSERLAVSVIFASFLNISGILLFWLRKSAITQILIAHSARRINLKSVHRRLENNLSKIAATQINSKLVSFQSGLLKNVKGPNKN
jgi:hypothetical protein